MMTSLQEPYDDDGCCYGEFDHQGKRPEQDEDAARTAEGAFLGLAFLFVVGVLWAVLS